MQMHIDGIENDFHLGIQQTDKSTLMCIEVLATILCNIIFIEKDLNTMFTERKLKIETN